MKWLKDNVVQILIALSAVLIGWGKLQGQVDDVGTRVEKIEQDRAKRIDAYEVLQREIISNQRAQGAKIDILLERTRP